MVKMVNVMLCVSITTTTTKNKILDLVLGAV